MFLCEDAAMRYSGVVGWISIALDPILLGIREPIPDGILAGADRLLEDSLNVARNPGENDYIREAVGWNLSADDFYAKIAELRGLTLTLGENNLMTRVDARRERYEFVAEIYRRLHRISTETLSSEHPL